MDNSSLIIHPTQTAELKGFLKGNRATNRFRFIQKTKQIQEHRGDRLDDGIVRIEFAFEKPWEPWVMKTIKEVHHHYDPPFHYTYYNSPDWNYSDNGTSAGNPMRSVGEVQSFNCNVDELGVVEDSLGEPAQDEGITVKGKKINQQFNYASIGQLEESQIIILRLKGTGVNQPLTVKTKLTCSTCGTKSSSSAKFCHNCGTFLE